MLSNHSQITVKGTLDCLNSISSFSQSAQKTNSELSVDSTLHKPFNLNNEWKKQRNKLVIQNSLPKSKKERYFLTAKFDAHYFLQHPLPPQYFGGHVHGLYAAELNSQVSDADAGAHAKQTFKRPQAALISRLVQTGKFHYVALQKNWKQINELWLLPGLWMATNLVSSGEC